MPRIATRLKVAGEVALGLATAGTGLIWALLFTLAFAGVPDESWDSGNRFAFNALLITAGVFIAPWPAITYLVMRGGERPVVRSLACAQAAALIGAGFLWGYLGLIALTAD